MVPTRPGMEKPFEIGYTLDKRFTGAARVLKFDCRERETIGGADVCESGPMHLGKENQ